MHEPLLLLVKYQVYPIRALIHIDAITITYIYIYYTRLYQLLENIYIYITHNIQLYPWISVEFGPLRVQSTQLDIFWYMLIFLPDVDPKRGFRNSFLRTCFFSHFNWPLRIFKFQTVLLFFVAGAYH